MDPGCPQKGCPLREPGCSRNQTAVPWGGGLSRPECERGEPLHAVCALQPLRGWRPASSPMLLLLCRWVVPALECLKHRQEANDLLFLGFPLKASYRVSHFWEREVGYTTVPGEPPREHSKMLHNILLNMSKGS